MRSSIFVVAILGGLVGCTKRSEKFCGLHPEDERCGGEGGDGGIDAAVPCDDAHPCSVGICHNMTCVECVDNATCEGTEPICDTSTNSCGPCTAHVECGSEVCLPSGACADPADVAYVQGGASGPACTEGDPCGTLAAALALTPPRSIVKVMMGPTVQSAATTTINRSVSLYADAGAKVDVSGDDATVLQISGGGTTVDIHELEITGATGSGAFGLQVSGGTPTVTLDRCRITQNTGGPGLSLVSGTLTITRSTITKNTGGILTSGGKLVLNRSIISGNTATGIVVSGQFDIVNNFIYRNGNITDAIVGGANLTVGAAGMNRFAFNTVTDNVSTGTSGGVFCNVPSFNAPNNIIARNHANNGETTNTNQTGGTGCMYPTSKLQAAIEDLAFVNPSTSPDFDYHITDASTAKDAATTAVDVTEDFDGETRPGGGQKDIGADERP